MDNSKEIQKGFNSGYLLAKHKPELSKKLLNGLQKTDNPYVLGLIEGSREVKKERDLELKKERPYPVTKLKKQSQNDKSSKEKGLDMDLR
jgi:hypothetical protein